MIRLLPSRTVRTGAAALALVILAGCGSAAAPKPSVQVAYAGSLAYLMDQQIGPAWQKSTGIQYQGRGGGSFGLAHEISSGTIPADVFLSIGTAPIVDAGKRAQWAVTFATAPLVVVYNKKSPFARQLEAIQAGKKPIQTLFQLMADPAFHLGRTNPVTDPQGRAFYLMVTLAQKLYGLSPSLPAQILGSPTNPKEVFSETGILTQLQAGNLDAASAFLPEALERHLPYITLPPALNFAKPQDVALYHQASMNIPHVGTVRGSLLTVAGTVLTGAQQALGVRFFSYLLSPQSRAVWTHDGYDWIPFQYLGKGIPTSVRHESP